MLLQRHLVIRPWHRQSSRTPLIPRSSHTTAKMDQVVFRGRSLIAGSASAELVASDIELSFWVGVDSKTGHVIDRFHPLCGHSLKNTILAIPSGRGSCTGSAVALELMLNGLGPKAFVFERVEEIITLGLLVAQEMFTESVPVIVLEPHDFRRMMEWNSKIVFVQDGHISTMAFETDHHGAIETSNSNQVGTEIQLTRADHQMLDGYEGEAAKLGLKIIIRMAEIMGASTLTDIAQAHMDGTWYGPGSFRFGETLRLLGGRFKVPTTLNALNIDRRLWRSHGVAPEFAEENEKLVRMFLDMGAQTSFTCAPYQLDSAPRKGERVAWGESNAVVFANSVLGARTLKNSNMLECLTALTGRAPLAGPYLDSFRKATVWVRVPMFEDVDDSFWPIVGHSIGTIVSNRVSVITGLEHLRPSLDDFKAFSAAFATSSSAPMYHIVNVTPEAPTLDSMCSEATRSCPIDLKLHNLQSCWKSFNQLPKPSNIDLISLGNPHFSLRELRMLLDLCRKRQKHKDVVMMITCGRSQHALGLQAGYVNELESFGAQFLTDTCWCFIEEPVIPTQARTIMTNSGKYAHYGPGLTGRQYCFGSLRQCVDAACNGVYLAEMPDWLTKGPP